MGFEYNWDNKEANFGPTIKGQVKGGTHITFEIILKLGENYLALRRESIPGHEPPPNFKKYPNGMLFFCHNLIRYGESVDDCVKRIVKSQAGVNVKNMKIVDIDSFVQGKDNQWAFTPHVIAELSKMPKKGKYGNEIKEVVTFNKNNIPDEFGWWTKEELKEFLEEFD